ncbi:MAG: nucleotidyltransferase family protein [Oscillospiraceae bacterium]
MSKSVGIVAEYNPFHTGHGYQIDFLHSKGFEDVVVAMSGSCVQRGQFALFSKFARAEMALLGGVDLVLEIPCPFSIKSAEGFADAGVKILKNAGVNALCFGSESDDLPLMKEIASYLLGEEYSLNLKKYLAQNLPFPQARQSAILQKFELTKDFLSASNDILAIEYLKACIKLDWDVEIIPLKRRGANYKDLEEKGDFASAGGIRNMICEYRTDIAQKFIPKKSLGIFEKCLDHGAFFIEDYAYEKALLFTLRGKTHRDFIACPDCNNELSHAFENAVSRAESLSQLFEFLPTKQYPKSRLNRIILWTLLDLDDIFPSSVPYLRILAMGEKGEKIVKNMSKTSVLPISSSIKILSEVSEECRKVCAAESLATDSFCGFCRIIQPPRTDFTTRVIKG